MIQTGIEPKVKVQQIIENQLPEYVLSESPNAVEFLKQFKDNDVDGILFDPPYSIHQIKYLYLKLYPLHELN